MKRALLSAGLLIVTGLAYGGGVAPPPDVTAPPDDARRTPSGLAFKNLEDGTGTAHPDPWDTVTVHYTGWTTDGVMFETTEGYDPPTLALNQVIPGWTEGLQLMVVGEKRRFWIPVELAYNHQPDRPAGMLVFDIQLLAIVDRPKPPQPRPPVDATCSASGLCSRIQAAGTGETRPGPNSIVTLHVVGWQAPGVIFHSTHDTGRPITLPVADLIPAWAEGVQSMVEGETRRLWAPPHLTYDSDAGMPTGMLVFDIELLKIKGHATQVSRRTTDSTGQGSIPRPAM